MTCKPTILIVDDQENLRRGIAMSLENTYQVLTAASGEEALQILESQPVDVVLTDYNLLGPLRGDAFLYVLREHFPKLKIAVITGDQAIQFETLKAKGVGGVIYKGETEDLMGACRKMIQQLLSQNQTMDRSSCCGDMGSF